MRRILSLVTVAALMAAMMVVGQVAAQAQDMGDTVVDCGGAYDTAADCADFYNGFDQTLQDLCDMGDQLACGNFAPTEDLHTNPNCYSDVIGEGNAC